MNAPGPGSSRPASRAWQTSFEVDAWQSYLSGLKRHWGGSLYREVVREADEALAPTVAALEHHMQTSPSYRLYAWLERRIQQMKWSGRWGFSTEVTRQKHQLAPLLAEAEGLAHLQLDPGLTVPAYIADTETHQQPGGLWREPVNAYALAWYTTGLSFALSDPDALVDFYAARIAERLSELALEPRAILDQGCTAGRSTRAIKRALPQAEVYGCDVCAGSLQLGALRTLEEHTPVTLVQCSADDLSFPDASLDVVASHWLWHELPPEVIRQTIREAARVLRPGGLLVAYDMFEAIGGTVGRWLLSGYAARNNEPYAHTLLEFDWRDELARAGFSDVQARYGLPQDPGPERPATLPPQRLHPMTFVSAVRRGRAF